MFTAAVFALLLVPAEPKPVLYPETMKVGDVGTLAISRAYTISSVLTDTFVVKAVGVAGPDGRGGGGTPMYFVVRGLPVKDLADDQAFRPTGAWKVVETTKVKTPGGGMKTLLVIEPTSKN